MTIQSSRIQCSTTWSIRKLFPHPALPAGSKGRIKQYPSNKCSKDVLMTVRFLELDLFLACDKYSTVSFVTCRTTVYGFVRMRNYVKCPLTKVRAESTRCTYLEVNTSRKTEDTKRVICWGLNFISLTH